MATYVVLLSWTDKGVQAVKDTLQRYEAAREKFESMGITYKDAYWTLGAHDNVSIVDAPDDETLAAALVALGSQGNVRTTTMRAFSADEFRSVLEKAG